MLAEDNDNLALAGLMLGQTAVDTVLGLVCRPDMATKIRAIDFLLACIV